MSKFREETAVIHEYTREVYKRDGVRPFKYQYEDDDLEFGEVNAKEVGAKFKKRKRRKKKESANALDHFPELARSLAPPPPADDDMLALLRSLASEAMRMARAEQDVVYCCGMIRPADYECPINGDHGFVYDEINSWKE